MLLWGGHVRYYVTRFQDAVTRRRPGYLTKHQKKLAGRIGH